MQKVAPTRVRELKMCIRDREKGERQQIHERWNSYLNSGRETSFLLRKKGMEDVYKRQPIYMTHGVRYVENHDETRVCSPLSWGGVGRVVLPAVMTLVYASGRCV